MSEIAEELERMANLLDEDWRRSVDFRVARVADRLRERSAELRATAQLQENT